MNECAKLHSFTKGPREGLVPPHRLVLETQNHWQQMPGNQDGLFAGGRARGSLGFAPPLALSLPSFFLFQSPFISSSQVPYKPTET